MFYCYSEINAKIKNNNLLTWYNAIKDSTKNCNSPVKLEIFPIYSITYSFTVNLSLHKLNKLESNIKWLGGVGGIVQLGSSKWSVRTG